MIRIVLLFTFLGRADPPPIPFGSDGTATAGGLSAFETIEHCTAYLATDEVRAAIRARAQVLADNLGNDAIFMVEPFCLPAPEPK